MFAARTALAGALLVVGLCAQFAVAGPVYNAVTDFSLSSNPSGAWTYGSGFGAALTSFTLTTANGWQGPALPGDVASQYSSSSASISLSDGSLLLVPTAILPDDLSQSATVRFSAPSDGNYHVHANLAAAMPTATGTSPVVTIYQNGQSLQTDALSLGHDLTFDRTLSLNSGDTLDFVNPPNVPQSELGVTLDATIESQSTQSIPLPSPLLAAFPAVVCAAIYYRHMKRRLS